MTEYEELYNDLFARRIYYQDIYNNELHIIKELKIFLLNSNINPIHINQRLYEFYQYFNIDVTFEMIQQAIIFGIIHTINEENSNDESNEENNEENNEDNNEETNEETNENNNEENNNTSIPQIRFYNTNLMNLLLSRINILNTTYENQLNNNMTPYQPFQDVLITTDDIDIEKLKINKLKNNLNINCSICISSLIKDDEIIKTKCNHTFHKDCIIKYLKEYSNKCPICRTEVGKTKCHL